MTYRVRRLEPRDASRFRDIRLEALADAPTAFGSDVPRETGFADQVWVDRITANPTFGVFDGDELVGIATFLRGSGLKRAHRGEVVGVYVKEKARGTGASRQMLGALIAAARESVVQLHLSVASHNHAARRLYEGLGFKRYATEPRSLLYEGCYYDEDLMVLRLDEGSGK